MTWMAHPYGFAATNTTRLRDDAGHVRDMLELVLFTAPGERVNRPDFGCGIATLLFAGNSPELALSVELTVQAAVQRWLGDVLAVEALGVSADDATLTIDLSYRLRRTGESRNTQLTRALT
jgi:phage baseplate assembly protein W